MSISDKSATDNFLETVSAGLAGDRELQLDVRAELRTHVEERRRDAEASGLSGAAAEAEALKAMGEPLELADTLAAANRRRMHLRALVRHAFRWVLIPVSILVVVLCASQLVQNSLWMLRADSLLGSILISITGNDPDSPELKKYDRSLMPVAPASATAEQRLMLEGLYPRSAGLSTSSSWRSSIRASPSDPRPEGARILWEKWPENRVYLHNYLSSELAWILVKPRRPNHAELVAGLEQTVAQFRPYDPGNARFDYVLALLDLQEAAKVEWVPIDPNDKTYPHPELKPVLKIQDRARLDQAMAHFRDGLKKPRLECHYGELERQCLGFVDRPTTIAESVRQVLLLETVRRPDGGVPSGYSQMFALYGEILAREGRTEEAGVFLEAWRPLVRQVLQGGEPGFARLMSVAGAASGGLVSADVYDRIGDPARAAAARMAARLVFDIYGRWYRQIEENKKLRKEPWPSEVSYCNSEHFNPLDVTADAEKQMHWSWTQGYLQWDHLMVGVLSCLFLLAMLFNLPGVLYFRFRHKSAPLLLLPGPAEILVIASVGTLLPWFVYRLLSAGVYACDTNTDHNDIWLFLSLQLFLGLSIWWLTTELSDHFLRRRCRQLGIEVPPPSHPGWRWAIAGLAALVPVFLVLVPKFLPPKAGFLMSLPMLVLLVLLFSTKPFFDWKVWRSVPPLYMASRDRSLIPVVALSVLFLNLVNIPWYRLEERRVVEEKLSILQPPGTYRPAYETAAAEKLHAELKAALEKADGGRPPPAEDGNLKEGR